jgi:dCTP deaminase
VPGVLAPEQVIKLADTGHLVGVDFAKSPPDGSSFDLHITDKAWILDGGSVKPDRSVFYSVFLKELGKPLQHSPEGIFNLDRNRTYVFEVREHLRGLTGSGIYGQATAKSSVGRMDVLARLIVDGTAGYESFSPNEKQLGMLYVEVTPITFPVRIRIGDSLSQLRLFYGSPGECTIHGKELARTIGTEDEALLHVDLTPTEIGNQKTVAFQAKEVQPADKIRPVDLWKSDRKADPCEYWKLCAPDAAQRLRLKQNAFYIFRSRERLKLPGGVAAYCRATDETIGEMRIHYAGFVHPWFGRNRTDNKEGTPLIFEVRGHDLSVNLRHDEVLARMTVYRMSRDISNPKPTDYDEQELTLSSFFEKWPKYLRADAEGNVSQE